MILEVGQRIGIESFHIIGSAAVLAVLPDPPEGALTATRDVDVVPPKNDEQLADRISFVLGEASEFDIEYGYYAQGVSPKTARFAPENRESRTIPVRVERYTGWCMEAHDLVLSKLGAGREKDFEFARGAVALDLVKQEELMTRLSLVRCKDEDRRRITTRIEALFA